MTDDPGFNQPDPFATALNDAIARGDILADECVDALDEMLARDEQSVRAAMSVYLVVPNAERMRGIAAVRKALDVLRRVRDNKSKVMPILFAPEIEAARREKAYQAKKQRERQEKAA